MTRKKIALTALTFIIAGFSPLMKPFPGVLFAEEIVVSGNGSESSSAVSGSTQSETAVQQSNQSQSTNTLTGNADTGSNQASGNNGETAIKTGDIDSGTEVKNQGNVSVVDTTGCCPDTENSITISGNGANSVNTVETSHATTITTSTNQTATITNNISGTASTGNNRANNNQGNVTIVTGDISHKETIVNGPINVSSVTVGLPSGSYVVKVNGNGAFSKNDVYTNNTVSHLSFTANATDIFNNSFWNLITGNNYANKNNGDVLIKTGDIKSEVAIVNKANVSVIKEECCREKPTEVPSPTPTQPTPTPNQEGKPGNGGGSSGNGGGSSNGASASSGPAGGQVLPITGTDWVMIAILGSILMLIFGVMLRLRSGRSPGFRYNFVI